jgi:NTE family protein
VTGKFLGSAQPSRFHESGVRARTVIDQLDYTTFPQSGYRLEAEAGFAKVDGGDQVKRIEIQGTYVLSAGPHTLNLHARARGAQGPSGNVIGRYTLGGFQNLSGYLPDQLSGDYLLFTRATWYMRLSKAPTLTRGFFVGASLEAGNAWLARSDVRLGDLRTGMSLFLGADTGIGPLYLGLTHAPRGGTGLSLFIGRL